jgi:photosystem II stability/assembly factor-like uncharacterized protein
MGVFAPADRGSTMQFHPLRTASLLAMSLIAASAVARQETPPAPPATPAPVEAPKQETPPAASQPETAAASPLPAQHQPSPRRHKSSTGSHDGGRSSARRARLRSKRPAPTLSESWISSLKWRLLGPANMGGRITALSINHADSTNFWVATASGGLLKTTTNGVNFEHQFDREATVSIGDVAVAASDPSIVWVGSGEANPRNSVSWGDGVYKSTDGGKTWANMGLKQTFQIGSVLIHPTNPDIVYVGAMGRCWGPNEDRGLYKTTDGGKSWSKILYIDPNTGIIDMVMSPTNPDTLLVAAWERQRDAFDGNDPIKKWGPGSAVYKTTDGGANFKKITEGIPSGYVGRIGFDVYHKDPTHVYAIMESEKAGMGFAGAPYLGLTGENADAGARITRVPEGGPRPRRGSKSARSSSHSMRHVSSRTRVCSPRCARKRLAMSSSSESFARGTRGPRAHARPAPGQPERSSLRHATGWPESQYPGSAGARWLPDGRHLQVHRLRRHVDPHQQSRAAPHVLQQDPRRSQ